MKLTNLKLVLSFCTAFAEALRPAPIYSVDFHPDGSCIATAGSANALKIDTASVLIWTTAPIWDATAAPAPPTNLRCHDGSANCVRWSNSGAYLASCGDDNIVVIWQRCGDAYAPRLKLMKHKDVVLHVAWRKDDQLLVSASVDLTLIIWRVDSSSGASGNRVVSVLRGHTDVVNGCDWLTDNTVVSQSNDLSLRVWNINNGTQDNVISKPFEDGAAILHFQRLAVSRDRTLILAVHAFNNKGPTVQSFDAVTMAQRTDFVGFRKAVVVVVSDLHHSRYIIHRLITCTYMFLEFA